MKKNIKSKINNFDLNNQKVFLRVDLNVPLNNGKIINDFKIKSIIPTLNLLIKKNCQIILATHIGKPEKFDPELSTKNILPWFIKQGYDIEYCQNLEDVKNKTKKIILIENLRFWPEEQNPSLDFAKKLKGDCEFYINDAFGVLHRDNTSITLLPDLFDKDHKSIGLLIEKELENLNRLKENPLKPFILIMGGSKVKDKLPLIESFINKVDKILLCPAIVFTFLKALNKNVGKSLVDPTVIDVARNIIDKVKNSSTEIIFPLDYIVSENDKNGEIKYLDSEILGSNDYGISFGPKTEKLYKNEIQNAKTIFFNGTMGFNDEENTEKELEKLLIDISQSHAFTVIGGGESVSAASKFGIFSAISFCSTGGGATLAYLANQNLPGLNHIT